MLISEVWDEFVQYKLLDEYCSDATTLTYANCIKKFIALEGDMEITSIEKKHINDAKIKMKKLSVARVASVMSCVRTFLKYCKEEIGVEVLDYSLVKIPTVPDKDIIYLTNDEIRILLENIDMSCMCGLRTRVLCEMLLDTGARINEALQLDRTSILTEDGITFARIIGKGKKQRKLFFSGRAMFWIERYLNAREDNHPALFINHKYINITRLERNYATTIFRRLGKKAGIKKRVSPHIFRHTFLTNLLKNGCSLAHLQRLAGHSKIKTTLKFYARVDDIDLVRAKQRLDYDFTPGVENTYGSDISNFE
jgi:integrase/recombinase XerD